jgi:hypothetical protein
VRSVVVGSACECSGAAKDWAWGCSAAVCYASECRVLLWAISVCVQRAAVGCACECRVLLWVVRVRAVVLLWTGRVGAVPLCAMQVITECCCGLHLCVCSATVGFACGCKLLQ